MKIAIIQDNQIIQHGEHIVLFPNVSFPINHIDSEWLTENNAVLVNSYKTTSDDEKLLFVEPYLDGSEVYDVQVVQKNQTDLDTEIAQTADIARYGRNSLLKDSDWTQTPDAPVDKSAWLVYRQALRDITLQEGFPFNIFWPEKP